MKALHIFKRFLLNLVLTFFYMVSNDILLFNAAITYYALLSFIPMLLIFGLVLRKIFLYFPQSVRYFEEMMGTVDIEMLEYVNILGLIKESNVAGFGIFGILSIFLTSTIFLRSINTVFKKIFRIKSVKETILHSLMPFFVYFSFLVIIIILLLSKVALLFLENFLVFYVDIDLSYPILILEKFSFLPLLFFLTLLSISYHFLSLRRLSWIDSIKLSLLFGFTIYCFNIAFKYFYNISFYNAVYGALSSLIITLAYVYIFFLSFLFWSQYGFVKNNYKGVLIRILFESAFNNPKSFLVKFFMMILKDRAFFGKSVTVEILKTNYDYAILLDGTLELVDDNGLSIYLSKYDFFKINDISGNVNFIPSEDCIILIFDQEEKLFLENDSSAASAIFKSSEKVLIL